MLKRIIPEIIYSKTKNVLKSPGVTLEDAINFGFSYVEHKDCIVEYIVSNKRIMKRIFGEIADSKVNPEHGSIGALWTAKLLLSDRLSDKHLIFSDSQFSAVIDIDLYPR